MAVITEGTVNRPVPPATCNVMGNVVDTACSQTVRYSSRQAASLQSVRASACDSSRPKTHCG